MSKGEPATTVRSWKDTGVGSVFVSNYPPYSFWSERDNPSVETALDAAPDDGTTLGLYLHVPFCRKRCKFCYFKVYTDKNSGEVDRYLDAVVRETEAHGRRAAVAGRPLRFVYFGGGTPSYISSRHLRSLADRMKRAIPWAGTEEVTFECEPGTLTERKVETIREIGVTRLSLGVENFDDRILEENGRAHVSREIYRAEPWIRRAGFDQVNVDLIAGMVGESWETWRDTVRRTVDLDPDSVTIYQMELPFNTVFSKQVQGGGGPRVADWETKRAWHRYAIEQLERAGYEVSSAYTMVRRGSDARFVYRDSVWHGCDLLPVGVSSFGHIGGVHFQNATAWDRYLERVESGRSAVERAFATRPHERMTRELILQLKLGSVDPEYFQGKFGTSIRDAFADAFDSLATEDWLEPGDGPVRLTRDAMLQVDMLLPRFYAPEYRDSRYT